MLFECKASLTLVNAGLRFKNAKVGIGIHKGQCFVLVSFLSTREKLAIDHITGINASRSKPVVTVNFKQPERVLAVNMQDCADGFSCNFYKTLISLKKKDDMAIRKCLKQVSELEGRMNVMSENLVVEDGKYAPGSLANNYLTRVSFTNMNTVPSALWKLEFLSDLTLSGCRLQELPLRSLRGIKSVLVSLNLSNNHISWIPQDIVLLSKLKSLNLTNNEITQMPIQMQFLKNLSRLVLKDNRLTFLPGCFRLMPSLTHLDVSHNRIDHVSELFIYPMRYEYIKVGPGRMKNIARLDHIDLSGNITRYRPVDKKWPTIDTINLETAMSPVRSLKELSLQVVMNHGFTQMISFRFIPKTVQQFERDNVRACARCKLWKIWFSVERTPIPSTQSLSLGTTILDANSMSIPIARYFCYSCHLKQTVKI